MPQPTFAGGTSQIARFGGRALPNGQGTMAWLNLNDGTSWTFQNLSLGGIQRQIGIQQQAYLAKSVYVADDFGPTTVILTMTYAEASAPIGTALAQLSQADEQYLTFDNKTYLLAKLQAVSSRVAVVGTSPLLWQFQLAFSIRNWPADFIPMGSTTNVLNPIGGFETLDGSNNQPLFRSFGGTSADGTLNAWTQDSGSWSIVANVVTAPASSVASMHAGHADWADGRARLRFIYATGSRIGLRVHQTATNNFIETFLAAAGTSITLRKNIAGVLTNITTSTAFGALVNGTAYWLEIVCAGTTYTSAIYNDSAGAIGAVIQPAAGTIADASVQSGYIAICPNVATSFTCGGNFVDVCSWYGDGHGWTPAVVSGEPAFAISTVSPQAGTYAGSINNLASADGRLQQTFTAVANTYDFQGYIKATGAGTADLEVTGSSTVTVTQDNTWHQTATGNVALSAGSKTFRARLNGVGTAYFDNLVLQQANDSTTGLTAQAFVDRVALTAGGGTTTNFSLTYLGSVFCEPVFTVNIPASSTGTIAQIILTNTMSGEALTISFPSALAGSTAYTLVIDSAAMTVTETIHSKSYDAIGSFPRLYGPAGQVNTFTCYAATGSGSHSGLSLDTTWTPRWEI